MSATCSDPGTPAAAGYRYGCLPREAAAVMRGRALLQAIVDGELPQAPISQALDFWLVEVGEGVAVFEGKPGTRLLNPMGSVHGGWALTLIDSVCGCAAHTLLDAGQGYVSVETKGNFSRPILADSGHVLAEGRVISRGRQIISAEAVIKAADGRILAHGSSTLMVAAIAGPG